jgi:pimeloyl-ACP methyl ester carboxylesterase
MRRLGNTVARGHRRVRLAVALVVAVAMAFAQPALARTGGSVSCHTYRESGTVPASLVPSGQPLPYTIVGELCAGAAGLPDGTTVQLLLHGGTYNHSYWDFGTIDGAQYSYARHLAAAGLPTFAIDHIGAGQSSKPSGGDVTNEVVAEVDHQVVQGLRDGSIAGTRFGRVIEVGHSFGSYAAWQEAITYQDVDGLIITGSVHHLSTFAASSAVDFYPANLDSKFQDQPWAASGYITTMPGTRRPLFYNAADADPAVICCTAASDDNATPFSQETFDNEPGKDAAPTGQFDGFALVSSTATQAIHVPVLIVLGSEDAFACGADAQGVDFDCSSGTAIANQEAPYYSSQARLEACSVPDSGHSISLHLNYGVQEIAATAWSYHFVGQNGQYGSANLPHACG